MNARERFEATRKAVKRMHDIDLRIMFEDDWKPEGVRSSRQISDPTANKAIYRVDERTPELESLIAEREEIRKMISESGIIIEAVKSQFIEKYGYVLEWRYIDCDTWTSIAEVYDVSERTVQNWAQWACEWVDSVGVSRLLRGQVEL